MTTFGINKFIDSITERQPTGRIGQPSDFAGVILFLSSVASAHMTGNVIELDGGSVRSGWKARKGSKI
jgi:NAD(P)-dependent dehydrogenase (short-subunit alcohol dehydrogenase family)